MPLLRRGDNPMGNHDGRIGTLFGGRYLLDGLLGVGGSAAVYEAEDLLETGEPRTPTRVAVKVLHPHLSATRDAREAFLREAERAQKLHHANVAAVLGSGLHDGGGLVLAWIALELVTGPTVAEWVDASGPLPSAEAASVMDGVLAGLGAAHACGLAHRDVSPRNVMLDGLDGLSRREDFGRVVVPKLVDFGLADAMGRTTVGGDVLLTDRGEMHGDAVVGNAAYMSPEQARGDGVGAAGDVYQAGALMYFLLTGGPPYPRGTLDQVLEAHRSAPPPVPSALVATARPFDRVVTRAMAKDPSHRYADAAEFRAAIVQALATSGTTLGPTRLLPKSGVPTEQPFVASRGDDAPPLDYLAVSSDAAEAEWATPRSSSGYVAAAIAVVLAGVAIWAVISGSLGSGSAVSTPTPQRSTTTAGASLSPPATARSAPSTSAPNEVRVPSLYGTLSAADATLRESGFTLGVVTRADSAQPADQVLSQSPTAGALVAPGTRIDVVAASGSNSVPELTGLTVGSATAALQSAGFAVTTDRPGAEATTLVVGSEPVTGTRLTVGVTVTLLLAQPTPIASATDPAPKTATPSSSGTPTPP